MHYTQCLFFVLVGCLVNSYAQDENLVKEVVKANWKVGLQTYKKVAQEDPTKSTFFSPYSITSCLFALLMGSKAETTTQIKHFTGLTEADIGEKYHLTQAKLYANVKENSGAYEKLFVAKRFFYDQSLKADPTFVSQLQSYYQISAQPVDFKNSPAAQGLINKFVSEGTSNLIDAIVPAGELGADTKFVVTSGIYFQGKWQYGFDPAMTKPAPFKAIDGAPKNVPFMASSGMYNYYAAPQFKASILEVSYETTHYAVYIVLPEPAYKLADFEANYLTTENLKAMVNAMQPTNVKLHLPKFETDMHYELSSEFKDMGLKEPFQPASADFEGIFGAGAGKTALNDYFNEAHVVFSESGSPAKPPAGAGPAVEFKADHPFMYAIICKHTRAPFFMGRFTGY